MEKLENGPISHIIGKDSLWLRYIDDIAFITSDNRNLEELLNKINEVHDKIEFTMEKPVNNQLPFLDTVIHLGGENFQFSVYRKPSNKEDLINYYSAHDTRTKRATIIGFFLRALRICSFIYLDKEIAHIKERFATLGYPEGFISMCLQKARKIINKAKLQPTLNELEKEKEKERKEREREKLQCVIPYSKMIGKLTHLLKDTINLITVPGIKIKDCVSSNKLEQQSYENSQIYSIKCSKCPALYIGETHRRLEQRTKEHKADFKYKRQHSAWVKHAEETLHFPEWSSICTVITNIRNKRRRRLIEAAYIKISKETINSNGGFFRLAHTIAENIFMDCNKKVYKKRYRLSDKL